jgi:hypothetical protein
MKEWNTELEHAKKTFLNFIDVVDAGGYRQDFVADSQTPESIAFWEFWRQQGAYKEFVLRMKS